MDQQKHSINAQWISDPQLLPSLLLQKNSINSTIGFHEFPVGLPSSSALRAMVRLSEASVEGVCAVLCLRFLQGLKVESGFAI